MLVQINLISQIQKHIDLIEEICNKSFNIDGKINAKNAFHNISSVRENVQIFEHFVLEVEKMEFLDIIHDNTKFQNKEFKYLRIKLFPILKKSIEELKKYCFWALESDSSTCLAKDNTIRHFVVIEKIKSFISVLKIMLQERVEENDNN